MENEKKTILIVEDQEDNYLLAEKILTHAGYAVEYVVDGEKALQWCEQYPVPHGILMDISLPGINGIEVTIQLRKKENYEKVPIIAVTAHAVKEVQEKILAAGCTYYLAKPYRPQELVRILKELVK
ncbi:MAG: response regulator [Planctomycetota bacterium]